MQDISQTMPMYPPAAIPAAMDGAGVLGGDAIGKYVFSFNHRKVMQSQFWLVGSGQNDCGTCIMPLELQLM